MDPILAIHLIEAPNEDDFYENRLETDLIRPIAQFSGISFTAHIVMNRDYFRKVLEKIKRDGECLPILHFAGHGNHEGISLPNKTLITWTELRELLIPVNERVGNILFVCMSCCEGLAAIEAAKSLLPNDPYFAIVGTSGKPIIGETSIAFSTFYHQLNIYFHQLRSGQKSDINLNAIIENMRAASLHIGWEWRSTKEIKENFKAILSPILPLHNKISGHPQQLPY